MEERYYNIKPKNNFWDMGFVVRVSLDKIKRCIEVLTDKEEIFENINLSLNSSGILKVNENYSAILISKEEAFKITHYQEEWDLDWM